MTASRSRSSLRGAVRRAVASLPPSLRRGFVASSLVAVSLPALPTPARGQGTGDPLSSPGGRFELRPYVGAYLPTGDQRDFLEVGGYGALGGDFGFGRFGLRLEARDYVSRFEPLIGDDESHTRNDVAVLAGLNYRF